MSKIIERPSIPLRDENSHKGTYGTALLICGSYGMAGAAVLAANAALRSGVGIAKLMVPSSIYTIAAGNASEAVFIPTGFKSAKKFGPFAARSAEKALEKVTAVLIGCGMGQGFFSARLVKFIVCNAQCPIIIDADGINMLSRSIDILMQAKAPVILTPHPAEMSRLCKKSIAEIEQNREKTASEFAKRYKVYLVLKGHETVVSSPDGEIFVNKTGNAGMATGGSGDTLAGIMAARIAAGGDVLTAVCDSVYIHGLAGDKAAERLSQTSLLPRDIIEELPCVFKSFER